MPRRKQQQQQQQHFPLCKNFFDCALVSEGSRHSSMFLHACPYGSNCPKLKDDTHSIHFYHFDLPLCPNGKSCPFLVDLEHRVSYHHPGERDYLAPCMYGRRCPDKRDPKHTSTYQHCTEPVYPALPAKLKAELESAMSVATEKKQETPEDMFVLGKESSLIIDISSEDDNNNGSGSAGTLSLGLIDDEPKVSAKKDETEMFSNHTYSSGGCTNNGNNDDGIIDLIDMCEEEESNDSKSCYGAEGSSGSNTFTSNTTKQIKPEQPPVLLGEGSSEQSFQATTDTEDDKLNSKGIQSIVGTIDAVACVGGIAPAEQPKQMSSELHFFQRQALAWMQQREKNGNGGLLCDEMGLGKTVEIISLIVSSRKRPTLVIVPLVSLEQWRSEICAHVKKEFQLSVCVYNGVSRKRFNETKDGWKDLMSYDVVVTNHHSVVGDWKRNGALMNVKWYRVVIDEAHVIKSMKTCFFKSMYELKSVKRWCVTGTPIQNTLMDLWSLLDFVGTDKGDKIHDTASFKKYVVNPFMYGKITEDLKSVIGTYVIRRTKSMTVDGKPLVVLPPYYLKDVYVAMQPISSLFYSIIENVIFKELQNMMDSGSLNKNMANVFLLLLRLRQCADHPFMPLRAIFFKEMTAKAMWDYKVLIKCFCKTMNNNAELIEAIASDDPGSELASLIPTINEDDPLPPPEKRCKKEEHDDILAISSDEEEEEEDDDDDDPLKDIFSLSDSSDLLANPELVLSSSGGVENNSSDDDRDKSEQKSKLKAKKTFDQEACGKELAVFPLDSAKVISPKIDEIIRIYREHTEKDPKTKFVIFSCFTSFLDLIQSRLYHEKIPLCRIDGSVEQETRDLIISEFKESKKPMVMLLTLKAGGVSLNLVCANVAIVSDPWWNPAMDSQAIQRVYRIGQEKPVYAYRLFTQATIEDRMKSLQDKKMVIAETSLSANVAGAAVRISELMREFITTWKEEKKAAKGRKKGEDKSGSEGYDNDDSEHKE